MSNTKNVYAGLLTALSLSLALLGASAGCKPRGPSSPGAERCEACLRDCEANNIPRGQCFNCRGLGGACGEPNK